MKRKQVEKLLITQTKRRNAILSFGLVIILVVILSMFFFTIYHFKNKAQFVNYKEYTNTNYKVYLRDNSFFEQDVLDNNYQYISTLIDRISTSFNYGITVEEKNIEYKYKYGIDAYIEVSDQNNQNILYNKKETLLEEQEFVTLDNKLNINEEIEFEYEKYNDVIEEFISTYKLDNTKSSLKINMYVYIAGECEEYQENPSNYSNMSVVIPLNSKTISIDKSENVSNSANNVLKCTTIKDIDKIYLILGIIFLIIAIGLLIYVVRFVLKNRTAETIYEKELQKILNNYRSYIQMLGNDFYFRDYHMLKVDSFEDMLEIRDTIRQPILMKENKEKNGAYFIIPSSTKLLYIYRLKVSDIEKEIYNQIKNTTK